MVSPELHGRFGSRLAERFAAREDACGIEVHASHLKGFSSATRPLTRNLNNQRQGTTRCRIHSIGSISCTGAATSGAHGSRRPWKLSAGVPGRSRSKEPASGEESAQDRPFMKRREPNSKALAVRPA